GPPKGVLYHHATFRGQAMEVQRFYDIAPGEIDLPGFPLFALFNAAMGVSTVIPEMDPTRPADIDPRAFIEIANDFQVTQSFGSPALWNTVSRYTEQQSHRCLPSIRRVLSAGAPVPAHVLKRVLATVAEDAEMHTPYGATEALPVASNSASVVLNETDALTAQGRGTCVGRRFGGMDWKVIAIQDGPIDSIDQITELPRGNIGELLVRGPVVSHRYVTRVDANALHKVRDGETIWHRMGDVGYLDETDRFWFCGRKAHRVRTAQGPMFTICCEAIANRHEQVYRSALVGVGETERQQPVMILEPWPEHWPSTDADQRRLIEEVRELLAQHEHTASIEHILLRRKLPVDIRHNSKIFREQLAPWAARRLR
ncbi:MAG: AMP-binding protein, partial [Planctomycetales bacterium]|nr:AMP-binding protein [Planctomycetales bacterium]